MYCNAKGINITQARDKEIFSLNLGFLLMLSLYVDDDDGADDDTVVSHIIVRHKFLFKHL